MPKKSSTEKPVKAVSEKTSKVAKPKVVKTTKSAAKKSSKTKKTTTQKAPKTEAKQLIHSSDELIKRFYQVVADLRTDEESKVFFLDFLTESERATFAKRLAIALELQGGKSYENIRQEYGVSSATISTVAEMMSSPGLQLALKKINTEQWAEDKSKKFMKLFGIK